MDTSGWEDRHRGLIARLAGVAGVAFIALSLAPGGLGGPIFDNTISTPQIVDWVKNNGGGISADGFVAAVGASIVSLFFVLLVRVTGSRGALAVIALSSTAAFVAIDWVHAGVYYAMADAGLRGQADAGIVALFSLAKMMTFADG